MQALGASRPLGEEVESFTALEILRQLHGMLRSLGITDVLRLQVDGVVYYEDKDGRPGDRDQAFMETLKGLDPLTSEVFSDLEMSVLHSLSTMDLLLDARIRREHPPGEYPLVLVIRSNTGPTVLGGETFRSYLQHLEFCLRQFFRVENTEITDNIDQEVPPHTQELKAEVVESDPEEDFFHRVREVLQEISRESRGSAWSQESYRSTSGTVKTTIYRKTRIFSR